MISRREVLGAKPVDRPTERGRIGGFQRLPDLHAEGVLDFLWGVERYNAACHAAAASDRADEILAETGSSVTAEMPVEQAIQLFANDPIIATRYKAYLDSQRLKMKVVGSTFSRHREYYLENLDGAAGSGPGSLSLGDALVVPDYARHELHMQPGGYVGDDLAGFVFRYAIVGLYSGHNFENEAHRAIAAAVPLPENGQVVRVLDLGCGIGQLILALNARFPQAEAWGIDTSAPMLRYAHLQSTEANAPIRFAQQSAEALNFPPDHFDIVTASGLFHEIAPSATRAILGEVARVLRPGGTFYPLDFYTSGTMKPKFDPKSRFETWISERWYHEDWREDYSEIDLPAELRKVALLPLKKDNGFQLGSAPVSNLMAVKRT